MSSIRVISSILILIFSLNFNLRAFTAPDTTPRESQPTIINIQEIPEETKAGTLTIWTNAETALVINGLADDLWAAYQVNLIVEIHTFLYDDFVNAVPLGTGPDIVVLAHDRLGYLEDNGYVAPITLGALAAQFQTSAIEACTVNGLLYGLPWATENLGFFYNTTLVPTPPTTWDQVQTMGEALQTSGDVLYGMSLAGNTYDAYPLMTAFGGYVFGQDTEGDWDPFDLGIDSPGMIAAVDWLGDRVADGFLSSNTDWSNAHTLFETGQTPFIMAGPWALDRIRASGVPYAITSFPSQTQSGIPFMGVQLFAINAASSNISMAETFLKEFVATESTMTALHQASNRPPAYQAVAANITDPDILIFMDIAATASPLPNIPEMGAVWGSWNDAVIFVLQGAQTAEVALSEAAQTIRDLILGIIYDGMVNVPGSYQSEIGCTADWQPNCVETSMTKISDTGWASGPFSIPAGSYEAKVALDGSWTTNYGVGGIQDGANYQFTVEEGESVSFYWDEVTKLLTIESLYLMVNVPGSYQSEVGCSGDWQPDCEGSAMTKSSDSVWISGPFYLPPGSYESKVAINGSWTINYGMGGEINGANIPFTVEQADAVYFYWDEDTKLLTIETPNVVFLPIITK